jgi:hypothetical protein
MTRVVAHLLHHWTHHLTRLHHRFIPQAGEQTAAQMAEPVLEHMAAKKGQKRGIKRAEHTHQHPAQRPWLALPGLSGLPAQRAARTAPDSAEQWMQVSAVFGFAAHIQSAVARYCHRLLLAAAGASLLACSSTPKPPDWQLDAKNAADRYLDAQLKGDTRAAQAEFALARRETAATGRPDLVARVELLRCAAQVASLNFEPCTGFDALRADAAAPELAYAAYLAGEPISAEQRALLPAAQQAVAGLNATGAAGSAGAALGTLAQQADPLSQLVAAGVLLRRAQAAPQVVQLAVDTASHQGWRRPLLAWLGVQASQAEAAGQTERAQALRRRMDLVAPSQAAPANPAPANAAPANTEPANTGPANTGPASTGPVHAAPANATAADAATAQPAPAKAAP